MITRDRLRAGIFLPPFHPNDEDPALLFERDFELIQYLDRLGYDEAWIGEHHSGGYEIYGSPELFIATAAERTKRIRLGTGVISLPYHHPLMVADRLVQLDYQTRGRAMFGFGPGLLPSDAMMLGIDPDTQRDRMADAIDIITRLLAGDIITRQSDWYTMREARLHLRPYTKPRPHLAIASAVTPYGGKLAGRYDLGMLCVMAGSPTRAAATAGARMVPSSSPNSPPSPAWGLRAATAMRGGRSTRQGRISCNNSMRSRTAGVVMWVNTSRRARCRVTWATASPSP